MKAITSTNITAMATSITASTGPHANTATIKHGESEHGHDTAQGIEWEDDMVEVNRKTTPANMRWKLVDRETGAENAQIDWTFHVGDQVKLRLVNEMDSITRCRTRSTSTAPAVS